MASTLTTSAAVGGDILYEVVHGEVVEIEPMGVYETWIASRLIQKLVGEEKHGRAVMEALFDFTKPLDKMRRPDVAFVSYDRWPRKEHPPRTEAWDVVPNLAIEVVSRTNPANEMVDKVAEYFHVGVQRVWVVYPSQRQVYVYTTPTDVRVLADHDELTDDVLLPGFRLALKELFDDTNSGDGDA
jgi:Uma2 family endonuclease